MAAEFSEDTVRVVLVVVASGLGALGHAATRRVARMGVEDDHRRAGVGVVAVDGPVWVAGTGGRRESAVPRTGV